MLKDSASYGKLLFESQLHNLYNIRRAFAVLEKNAFEDGLRQQELLNNLRYHLLVL